MTACGQCFSYAIVQAMLDKSVTVVHAVVSDPWSGKRYQHAWVEKGGRAMDWQSMEAKLGKYPGKGWPVREFYKVYNPKRVKKYSGKEAVALRKQFGHAGPWDKEKLAMELVRCAKLLLASFEGIVNKWRGKGLDIYVFEGASGFVIISELVVPKELRKEGLGTAFMQDITRWADSAGKDMALTPDTTFGGTSVGRLKKFYKRFGFVENKGRNKDFRVRETMIRRAR